MSQSFTSGQALHRAVVDRWRSRCEISEAPLRREVEAGIKLCGFRGVSSSTLCESRMMCRRPAPMHGCPPLYPDSKPSVDRGIRVSTTSSCGVGDAIGRGRKALPKPLENDAVSTSHPSGGRLLPPSSAFATLPDSGAMWSCWMGVCSSDVVAPVPHARSASLSYLASRPRLTAR